VSLCTFRAPFRRQRQWETDNLAIAERKNKEKEKEDTTAVLQQPEETEEPWQPRK
jgi:hypothetical protein